MHSQLNTNQKRIDAMCDADIDYSDIPKVTEEFFKMAFMHKPISLKIMLVI